MTKKLFLGVALIALFAFATCTPRRIIQTDFGLRLDAIEARLDNIEAKLAELETFDKDVSKANQNDLILNENLERLYKEVDELREKMGMPLTKPRKELVK